MMIKIDKGVPLPDDSRGRKSIYPWHLEVGESFFVPEKTTTQIAGSVSYQKRSTNNKYTVRTVTENGVNGVRVWRTS